MIQRGSGMCSWPKSRTTGLMMNAIYLVLCLLNSTHGLRKAFSLEAFAKPAKGSGGRGEQVVSGAEGQIRVQGAWCSWIVGSCVLESRAPHRKSFCRGVHWLNSKLSLYTVRFCGSIWRMTTEELVITWTTPDFERVHDIGAVVEHLEHSVDAYKATSP